MDKNHRTWKFFGLAILVITIALSFMIMWQFIDVIILALALAYIVYPVAKYLSKGKTDHSNRYLLASGLAILLVAIPVTLAIIYSMNFTMRWFIQNFPSIYSGQFVLEMKTGLKTMGLGIVSERIVSEFGKFVSGFANSISVSVLKPTWLLGIFVKVVMFFILSFYFVYEGPHVRKLIDKYVPAREKFLKELINYFDRIFYSLFVGHFFTSVIAGLFAAVGFWLILQPSILTLGMLSIMVFLVAFLPIVGAWLVYVPLGLWQMLYLPDGFSKGLAIIVFGVIFLNMIPDLYLRPKLVQRGSEIHPILFLIGFFGGPILMGAKGIIIGPLLLGLAQAIVVLYIEKRHILRELIEHF